MGIHVSQPGANVELTSEQLNALVNQVSNVLQRKFKIFKGKEAEQVHVGCYRFKIFENSSTLLLGSVQVGLNGVYYNSNINQTDSSSGSDFYIDDKNVYFRDARAGGTITSLDDDDEIFISYHEVE
jgi:hypothetical protein